MDAGLEHYSCVRKQIDAFSIAERFWIVFMVLLPEFFHDSVYFLTFSRQPKARE